MSVTLSFSRIWSYFVLFGPVPAPPGLARVPPGPPQASRGRFATGDRKKGENNEKSFVFETNGNEWKTNGLDDSPLLP